MNAPQRRTSSTRWTFAALAVGLLAASAARASNYPPDYPMHHDLSEAAQSETPVAFARTVTYAGDVSLSLHYTGRLAHKAMYDPNLVGKLRVWLRLNGVDAVLPVEVAMADPRNPVGMVWASTGPHDCHNSGTWSWQCRQSDPNMARLFTFARQPASTWSLNAWDIEAAFFIEGTDEWDSLDGANYRFRFEPYWAGY